MKKSSAKSALIKIFGNAVTHYLKGHPGTFVSAFPLIFMPAWM